MTYFIWSNFRNCPYSVFPKSQFRSIIHFKSNLLFIICLPVVRIDFCLLINCIICKKKVLCIHVCKELRAFVTSGKDGRIFIYNLYNFKVIQSINHPSNFPINNVFITSYPLYSIIFFSKNDLNIYSYSING